MSFSPVFSQDSLYFVLLPQISVTFENNSLTQNWQIQSSGSSCHCCFMFPTRQYLLWRLFIVFLIPSGWLSVTLPELSVLIHLWCSIILSVWLFFLMANCHYVVKWLAQVIPIWISFGIHLQIYDTICCVFFEIACVYCFLLCCAKMLNYRNFFVEVGSEQKSKRKRPLFLSLVKTECLARV